MFTLNLKPGEFSSEVWDSIPPGTLLISDKGVLVIVVHPSNTELTSSVCVCTTGKIEHHSNHTGLKTV